MFLILAPFEPEYPETVHFGNIDVLTRFRLELGIDLYFFFIYNQQNIRKRTAEIGSINVMTFLLRHIDLLASRTINFDS